MTDAQLLIQYAADRSDAAFAELVRRHAGLVYSAARRQVRDAAMAQDVTQAVFVVLAKKANGLGKDANVTSWLYTTTRLTAKQAMRAAARRRRHEQSAARGEGVVATPEQAWAEVSPHLDEAMASLRESDRQLILWRFFENRPHTETATLLGVNENTATQRVLRAVDKLRSILSRKGVVAPAATLSTLLATNAVEAVPPAVLAAVGTPTTAALLIAKGTLSVLTLIKLKTVTLVVLALMLTASTAMVVVHAAANPPTAGNAGNPAAPASPAKPVFEAGTGATQVVWFEWMASSEIVDRIRRAPQTIAVPSESTGFEVLRASSGALNPILAESKDRFMGNLSAQFVNPELERQNFTFMVSSRITRPGGDYRLNSNAGNSNCRITLGREKATLTADFANIKLMLNDMQARVLETPGHVKFTTDASPGQSVVAMAKVGAAPNDVWVMMVWQTIQATPGRMAMIEQRRVATEQWINEGMTSLVADADDGLAWEKRVGPRQSVRRRALIKKIGETPISIEGISRPADGFYRWWDAAGRPIHPPTSQSGPASSDLLVAYSLPAGPQMRRMGFASVAHPNRGPFRLRLGLSEGAWTEIATLAEGKPWSKEGVEVELTKAETLGVNTLCHWTLKREDQVTFDYRLVAVTSAGKRVAGSNEGPILHEPQAPRPDVHRGMDHLTIASKDILHFALERRPVQWMEIADLPSVPDLSLAGLPATQPMPDLATPEGTVAHLFELLNRRKPADAAALFEDAPATKELVAAVIAFQQSSVELHRAAVERFGEAEVTRIRLTATHMTVEAPRLFTSAEWTIDNDLATTRDQSLMGMVLKRRDGQWRISIEAIIQPLGAGKVDVLAQWIRKREQGLAEGLHQLKAGKFADGYALAEAIRQLDSAVPPPEMGK